MVFTLARISSAVVASHMAKRAEIDDADGLASAMNIAFWPASRNAVRVLGRWQVLGREPGKLVCPGIEPGFFPEDFGHARRQPGCESRIQKQEA